MEKLKISVARKIELTMSTNFTSSKDRNDKKLMHSKDANKEIIIDQETDEIIKEIFHSLRTRY